MEAKSGKTRKTKKTWGRKHLPIKVLISIRKAGITKDEFFLQYPSYSPKKQLPEIQIEQPPSVEELAKPDIEVIQTSKGSQNRRNRSSRTIKGSSKISSNPHKQKSMVNESLIKQCVLFIGPV